MQPQSSLSGLVSGLLSGEVTLPDGVSGEAGAREVLMGGRVVRGEVGVAVAAVAGAAIGAGWRTCSCAIWLVSGSPLMVSALVIRI